MGNGASAAPVQEHSMPEELDYDAGVKVVEELHGLTTDEEKQAAKEVLASKWVKDGEQYAKVTKDDFVKAYEEHYAEPAEEAQDTEAAPAEEAQDTEAAPAEEAQDTEAAQAEEAQDTEAAPAEEDQATEAAEEGQATEAAEEGQETEEDKPEGQETQEASA